MSRGETPFETLWQASGLARVAPQLRAARTITARLAEAARRGDDSLAKTLAAETIAAPPPDFTSEPPAGSSLPHVTLADGAPGEGGQGDKGNELQVVSVLGEGGMGRVLLARQRWLGRDVAVKVLKPEARSGVGAEALVREARLSGGLEHPNIVPVHALGRDDEGRPVLVMKRVEGVSWRDLLDDASHDAWATIPGANSGREHARLDAHLGVLMSVCDALRFAHARGIVHRDVKPENVLIGSFGEVYLADWGIALRVGEPAHTVMVGTPGYMAPEMLSGDPAKVDARTDVFLAGATLHEVLTGRMRHEGATVYEVLLAAFECAPARYGAGHPEELCALCAKATARDPRARFADAGALREAISDYFLYRGSNALTERSEARLDELRSEARDPASADVARVHRLASECHFGFAQALREWPSNEAARRGASEAFAVVAGFELARENAEAAEAAIAQLGDGSPEYEPLRARHRALCERLARRRAHDDSLRAMERDLDVRVGATSRTRGFIALIVIDLGLGVLAATRGRYDNRLTHAQVLAVGGGTFTIIAVVVVLWRRTLLANLASRRMVWTVLLTSAGLTAHRFAAWRLGLDPASGFALDMIVMGLGSSVAAATVTAWLWPTSVVLVAGGLITATAHWPGEMSIAVVSALAFSLGAASWWLSGRRAERAPSAAPARDDGA